MTRPAIFLLSLAPVLLWAAPARAQKAKPTPGDEMIAKYLAAETDRLSKRELDGATSLEEWQKRRPRLKQEYLHMLGLWPLPEKTPLKATVTGQIEHEGVVIEKLHYQSRPGLYVTANLYRPKAKGGRTPSEKLPAILYLCGHSNRGRDGNKTAFQDHGLWFASNGYVCLMLDTLQLGEIPGVHHGTYGRPYNHLKAYSIKDKDKGETRWWWHARGYTPAGVECWNGVRGIDYLVSRPEVDPERIGVTGISGGGAATFWVAAADERVKCAVPVSGMSDLQSYVKDRVIDGHCDCMFLYNTCQWEWTTIAALVAPRPLLFANSDNDRIFPMDGNRRIIERLRKLYKMYGKPGLVDEYVSKGGHEYRPDLRVAVFRFINKHLKGYTGPVKDADFKLLPGKALRVFPKDKDIPKVVLNHKIDESFVPKAEVRLPAKDSFAKWKKSLLDQLREQCFRNLLQRVPPAGKGKRFDDQAWQIASGPVFTDDGVKVLIEWGGAKAVFDRIRTGALLVSNPDDKIADWPTRELLQTADVMYVLLSRGIGEAGWTRESPPDAAWTRKSPPNYVERSHVLLGRTVDEGRVRDLIATYRYLAETMAEKNKLYKGCEWKIVGRGQAGILAAYAALLEPSIKEVVIIDPPKSHMEGPHFLNVLRVLDIPEALGLLAPNVRLTLINARDPAFDRTEQIYRLAGAADKFTRK